MEINGQKPLDFDMTAAHWQFILPHLSTVDGMILEDALNSGFYKWIMAGTGLQNRNTVKKMSQQVLTDKEIHPIAKRIKKFLFAELPSLELYCQGIWAKGKTVQCTLQTKESDFVNGVALALIKANKWVVTFYDGFWLDPQDSKRLTEDRIDSFGS